MLFGSIVIVLRPSKNVRISEPTKKRTCEIDQYRGCILYAFVVWYVCLATVIQIRLMSFQMRRVPQTYDKLNRDFKQAQGIVFTLFLYMQSLYDATIWIFLLSSLTNNNVTVFIWPVQTIDIVNSDEQIHLRNASDFFSTYNFKQLISVNKCFDVT